MVNGNDRREQGWLRRWCGAVLLVCLLSLGTSCASLARSDAFLPGQTMGRVQTDSLRELSGIAASRRHPGVLYVHNDSGDAPQVYALSEQAQLLGTCLIRGAGEQDWEDIAVGPGPDPNRSYLYIGDIGDNGGRRPEVVVYRLPEPELDVAQPFGQIEIGPAEALRLRYPDGPRDAETLLVDPLTRDLYLISKRDFIPRVYRAAYPPATDRATQLEPVAVLPFGLFPTGGDVSPDGRRVIVRGMFGAALWERPAGKGTADGQAAAAGPVPLWRAFLGPAQAIPVAGEAQGEAICFDGRGQGYFTISEGTHPALYYYAIAEPKAPGGEAGKAAGTRRDP